jgi:asparagine synthase (glutamine-hydrolysing)
LGNIQDDERRFFETNSVFTDEERHSLLNNPMQNPISIFRKSNAESLIDKQLYTDLRFILPNKSLKKIDSSAMANSIEIRMPFLDHNFVEFAVSIPSNKKLKLLDTKHILKKSVSSFVPKEMINSGKRELNIPLREWFRNELKGPIYELILGEKTRARNYFDFNYIEKIWNQHQNKTFNYEKKLFSLAAFELWHRTFIDQENPTPKALNQLT